MWRLAQRGSDNRTIRCALERIHPRGLRKALLAAAVVVPVVAFIASESPAPHADGGAPAIRLVSASVSCVPTNVAVTYQSSYAKNASPAYYVTESTVTGIPAACEGDWVSVALTNSAKQTIGSGSVGISATAMAVAISPNGTLYPLAHNVTGVSVSFYSNVLNGNLEVKKGQTYNCSFLTVSGSVTVDVGGSFNGSWCTVTGNLGSSGTASLVHSSINGNLQATGPGSLSVSSSSVGGNLQVQSLTGSTGAVICTTGVKNGLNVQSVSVPVQLGGSSACLGNTIMGNLIVQSNTGRLTIGSGTASPSNAAGTGNTASGNIVVQSNSVSTTSTLGGNWAGGNCILTGNNPKVTVTSATSNYAGGNNNCKVSG